MTKAAELLYITHSGLSKSMKLLQEELGCVLLRPSGRGLALTEEGMKIYQKAKLFLAREEELFAVRLEIQQHSLRIGTVEIFLSALSGQLKPQGMDSLNLCLLDLNPGQIEQFIANRQLDYGITYAPYPMDCLEITEVGTYQLGCYCLNGCFQGMGISEIPFVVPAQGISGNPLGIKERDGWLESITPRKNKYRVNLLSTGMQLAQQGLCAIFIPKFLARNYPELVELPIPKAQKAIQRAFLIKHKDQSQDRLFRLMKKTVNSIITAKPAGTHPN